MYAVKTENLIKNFDKYADLVTQGAKLLIERPNNKKIIMLTEQEYNEVEETRKRALEEFGETIKDIQEQSVIRGVSEMTMDEINEIINSDD